MNPVPLENLLGLLKGMNAAIIYDILALILMFFLFFTAVNQKLGQMMHFFYDGVPTFIFEIVV
jgi:hypothetical protein